MARSKFGRGLGTDVALLYPIMAFRTITTLIMLPERSSITLPQLMHHIIIIILNSEELIATLHFNHIY